MKMLQLFKHRLGRNLTAQVYSQVSTVLIQLITIPILLHAWGLQKYGVWLTLTAIPTYLIFVDFGFTMIAKNEMAAQVASGDRPAALQTYQSVLWLMACICSVLLVLLSAGIYFSPIDTWLNVAPISAQEVKFVLAYQLVGVLLYQFFYLLCSGVRCEGRPATETGIAASLRLAECAVLLIAAEFGAEMATAALCAIVVRAVSTVALAYWLMLTSPWLTLGFRHASLQRVKSLWWPSTSYMLVPLANATQIQGPLILLGAVATPSIVALYSTTRTVTRMGTAVANMITQAFVAEYSFAWGEKNFTRLNVLMNYHARAVAAWSIVYSAVLATFGSYTVGLMSHGAIVCPPDLMLVLGIAVIAEIIWSSAFGLLTAVSRHSKISVAFCLIVAVSAAVVSETADLTRIALAVATIQILTAIIASSAAWKIYIKGSLN